MVECSNVQGFKDIFLHFVFELRYLQLRTQFISHLLQRRMRNFRSDSDRSPETTQLDRKKYIKAERTQ